VQQTPFPQERIQEDIHVPYQSRGLGLLIEEKESHTYMATNILTDEKKNIVRYMAGYVAVKLSKRAQRTWSLKQSNSSL
jgi:hypothetical protein